MATDKLIACHDCDTLFRMPRLSGKEKARCPRCGAILAQAESSQLDRICAMTLAALVTFIIAQSFPIIELDANGITSASSLFGALVVLWGENMELVAVIVFCATTLFPLTELVALLYVLLPVRHGVVPPGFNTVLRAIQFVRPWGMLEVFMLGVLITIVKMVSLARVIPETALFAFGVLTLMFTVVVTFDSRTLWDIADDLRARDAARRRGPAGDPGGGSDSGPAPHDPRASAGAARALHAGGSASRASATTPAASATTSPSPSPSTGAPPAELAAPAIDTPPTRGASHDAAPGLHPR